MNRKQAGVFAIGVLAVAIAIVVAGGFFGHAGPPPAGKETAAAAKVPPAGTADAQAPAGAANAGPGGGAGIAAEGSGEDAGPAAGMAAGSPTVGRGPAEGDAASAGSPAETGKEAGGSPDPAAGQAPQESPPAAKAASSAAEGGAGAPAAAAAAGDGASGRPGPSFDLLRVEPDGSTLIAGRAAPGSKVEIIDRSTGKTLLTAEADATGSFVAIFDDPLAPGNHELMLKSVGRDRPDRYSEEVATVSVPEDGNGDDLLAMVSKPGEASRIIAGPKPKSAGARSGEAAPAEMASAPVDAASAPVGSVNPSAGGGSAQPGIRPGAPQDEKQGRAQIHVDAVEAENDNLYVAGSAPRKSTVRIYADDKYVGEGRATGEGRFVVNGKAPLAPGKHTVRADLVDSATGKVAMRATVPFDRPAGGNFAAVSPQVAGIGPAADAAAAGIADLEKAARDSVAELKRKIGAATPNANDIEAARKVAEKDLDALLRAVRRAAGGKAGAGDGGQPPEGAAGEALALIRSLPALDGNVKLDTGRLKKLRSGIDDAESRLAAMPASSATIASAGGPATVVQPALTNSDNFVIIRRGDTLWQISRRTYGRGIRYTTIYLANSEQISNPNLILPGQVFDVPGKPRKTVDEAIRLHRDLLRKERRSR